jgi:hypothetical protein
MMKNNKIQIILRKSWQLSSAGLLGQKKNQ